MTEDLCLTRTGMNPRGEPCRFPAAHLGCHSWDLTLQAEEREARVNAGRVTLSKAELMQAIGDAAARKLGRLGHHQVIARFHYAPDGELTGIDIELLPTANALERPFSGEDPRTPRVE